MLSYFFNDDFFFLISFCIFFILFFPKIARIIISVLDKNIKKINFEIEKAKNMEKDALVLLKSIKLKYLNALKEQKRIIGELERKIEKSFLNAEIVIKNNEKFCMKNAYCVAVRDMDELISRLKLEIIQLSIDSVLELLKKKMKNNKEYSEYITNYSISLFISNISKHQ